MDSPKILYKYYSNPAFCGQSEVVFSQKTPCVTSKIIERKRIPPLGANSPRKPEKSNHRIKTDISDNPLRIPPAGSSKYVRDVPPELPPKPPKYSHSRNNSSTFQRQGSLNVSSRNRSRTGPELEMTVRRKYSENNDENPKHRYEVIDDDFDDLTDYSPTKKRIVQIQDDDVIEYNVDGPDEHEMVEIPSEIIKTVNGRAHRYAIVPSDDDEPKCVTFTSPVMSKKSLIATQKLHDLLTTPRKLKSYASQPSVRITPSKNESPRTHTTKKLVSSTPTKVTPSRSCANLTIYKDATSPISPKAVQKLNYGLADTRNDVFVRSFRERSFERSYEERKNRSLDFDRRESRRDFERERRVEPIRKDKTTAVISPRVASPVYSEETYKSFSSLKSTAASASLALAAVMMTLCGGLTAGLSFYMMYSVGRRYYLDFGVLSGFTCLLLGLLGFRSRRYQLLPNRNYVSGYILLSSFSLLSATGLLILLTTQPKPGTPQNDITSGAVCALSVISLLLASLGVLSSYCCRHPPPDNRVGSSRWY